MRETMYFFIFEKLVFFLDLPLLSLSNNLSPEVLFWGHNAIMLLQAIGRMSFYSLIIHTPDFKMTSVQPASSTEPKFYVRTPQFLEPRRPSFLEPLKPSKGKAKAKQGPSDAKHSKSSLHQQKPSGDERSSSSTSTSTGVREPQVVVVQVLGQPGPSRENIDLPSVEC